MTIEIREPINPTHVENVDYIVRCLRVRRFLLKLET